MTYSLKGVFLDVDGVIVGEKVGFNSPWPHPLVIEALRSVRDRGIPVCLITAKPYFAIEKIVKEAGLHNPHVTDGGSVVVDPLDNVVVKKEVIAPSLVKEVLIKFIESDVYVEAYTPDGYYVQVQQQCEITEKHEHILQKAPVVTTSLPTAVDGLEVVKLMPIASNSEDIKRVEKVFEPFKELLNLYWAVHPVALPLQFGVVVPKGISKTKGIQEMAKSLKLSFEDILGVGDSTSDWQFLQLCKYKAAMGNASSELKNLVLSSGTGNSFIGLGVDENGVLSILKHFNLL